MATIDIVWSGADGQTRRILHEIEQQLRAAGHRLEVVNAESPPRGWSLGQTDAVLVAGWLEDGHYSEGLRHLLRQESVRIAAVPAAFLSVSLTAVDPRRNPETNAGMQRLLAETGLKPALTLSAAGALRYPEYSGNQKHEMKRLAKRLGLPTDTAQVHEFTDWEAVRAFTAKLEELAAAGAAQHA